MFVSGTGFVSDTGSSRSVDCNLRKAVLPSASIAIQGSYRAPRRKWSDRFSANSRLNSPAEGVRDAGLIRSTPWPTAQSRAVASKA